jgi:glucosamine--fructose-6-phosphate aminotransferase (isomerizing)
VIAARGTSDNAGRYAQYLLGAVNGLMVTLATPSLYSIYKRPPRFGNALVLGISQSGKSPDIVSVLAEARRQGALTAAITNFPHSDLGRQAEHVIALHAGEERSIAATKTYTTSLAAIAALSAAIADSDAAMQPALAAMPDQLADTLALSPEIGRMAERYRYMRDCVVLGRGFNYATAFELALKMKELTYTIAEPYSSADFMHGPLALIEHGFPAIVAAPSGVVLPEMQEFIRTLKAARGRGDRHQRRCGDAGAGAHPAAAAPRRAGMALAAQRHRAVASSSPCTWPRARLRPGSSAGAAEGDGDTIARADEH